MSIILSRNQDQGYYVCQELFKMMKGKHIVTIGQKIGDASVVTYAGTFDALIRML